VGHDVLGHEVEVLEVVEVEHLQVEPGRAGLGEPQGLRDHLVRVPGTPGAPSGSIAP
jgi:hypothetical protein